MKVLEPMMDAIDKGYKNIVVEMPVGGGKSVVAKTIPQIYDSSSYIVTNTNRSAIIMQFSYCQPYWLVL